MALFAVSYQLNKSKDYQPVWDALEDLGAHKVMRSFWFVDCDTTAIALRDHLRSVLDDDDAVCVVPFNSRPSHHMGYTGTNDWIRARV